jgi:hypothetical protein
MKTFLAYLFIVVFSIFLGLSCSDEPTDIGSDLIPKTDAPTIDSVVTKATSSSSFLFPIRANANPQFLGKYRDIEAIMLLQFTDFSAIPTGATIDSATLQLTANYRFKDSTGILEFTVHQIRTPWDQATFLWDNFVASLYDNIPASSFKQYFNQQDSVISVRIDNLVRSWYRTSGNPPNGIILIPTIDPSNDIILGIKRDPHLSVVYHDTNGSPDTITIAAVQQTSIVNGSPPGQEGWIYLQSGVAYRGLLRFDSLVIPPKAAITQAILEIPFDTTASMTNSATSEDILAYLLRENSSPYDKLALGTLCSSTYSGSRKVFRADIKSIIQQWVTKEPNYGLVLRSLTEFTALDRFALHSATASDSLRPRLKITYTKFP